MPKIYYADTKKNVNVTYDYIHETFRKKLLAEIVEPATSFFSERNVWGALRSMNIWAFSSMNSWNIERLHMRWENRLGEPWGVSLTGLNNQ